MTLKNDGYQTIPETNVYTFDLYSSRSESTLNVYNSLFTKKMGYLGGGAIYGGSLNIYNSVFTLNSAIMGERSMEYETSLIQH